MDGKRRRAQESLGRNGGQRHRCNVFAQPAIGRQLRINARFARQLVRGNRTGADLFGFRLRQFEIGWHIIRKKLLGLIDCRVGDGTIFRASLPELRGIADLAER